MTRTDGTGWSAAGREGAGVCRGAAVTLAGAGVGLCAATAGVASGVVVSGDATGCFIGRSTFTRAARSFAISSDQLCVASIGMIPLHTEHRARMPGPAIFAGSTRKIDWHSGQVTFISRRRL
jgi:hypothetical protein